MIVIAGSGLSPYDLSSLPMGRWGGPDGPFDLVVADRNYDTAENREFMETNLISMGGESLQEGQNFFFGSILDCRKRIGERRRADPEAKILYIVTGGALFFSGTTGLISYLEKEVVGFDQEREVKIIAGESSLDRIANRFRIDLRDLDYLSLHGRDRLDLDHFLKRRFTLILCDARTPAHLYWALRWFSPEALRITLFSRLGYRDEKVHSVTVRELSGMVPPEPFVILIERLLIPEDPPVLSQENLKSDGGMITKPGKRARILSTLQLEAGMLLWDIGAGSGSVGIEAALKSRVFPVFFEKDPRRAEHIQENLERYQVVGARLVTGDAGDFLFSSEDDGRSAFQFPDTPEALSGSRPNRIFLGGGGSSLAGRLPDILTHLEPGGRMVAAYVVLNHLAKAMGTLEGAKIPFHVIEVSETEYRSGSMMLGESSRPLYLLVVDRLPEGKTDSES